MRRVRDRRRKGRGEGSCGQSCSATSDLGCQFMFTEAESAAGLGTRAPANLVRLRLPGRKKKISERKGCPRVPTYPACARFKVAGGRLGEVRHAADISAVTAAFPLEADVPALLQRGALEALRDISTPRKQRKDIPLKVNRHWRVALRREERSHLHGLVL